jgi:DNA processing protein
MYSDVMEKDIRIMMPADTDWPALLQEIPERPKKLFVRGFWPPIGTDAETQFLCIVGARRHSSYGREACEKLVAGLAGYNICIVSGLALGIDAIAHESALAAGLPTIAFPGSGLDHSVMYPPRNQRLADRIVAAGGALLSEFDMDTVAAPWSFPKRNRLMAGISHATLVIEAKRPSGTLITSSFAGDFNRDVFAVPGDIFSPLSEGPHMLIARGAAIITSSRDILHEFGIHPHDETDTNNAQETSSEEKIVLELLEQAGSRMHKDELIHLLIAGGEHRQPMEISAVNSLISLMEIRKIIDDDEDTIRISPKPLFAKKIASV